MSSRYTNSIDERKGDVSCLPVVDSLDDDVLKTRLLNDLGTWIWDR